ncbi:MAG: hypothetical protein AB1512_20605 [Thermodesulfobacteriota bacterium]
MLNANREQLRHSAQTKKDAANALVGYRQPHSAPAVYLSHVALECALKCRILIKNKARDIDDLKKYLPKETFDALFRGPTGHDLHHLEQTAALRRYLEASGHKTLLQKREWRDMGGQRPYSLRYGVETVSADNAAEQVRFAAILVDLVLQETA